MAEKQKKIVLTLEMKKKILAEVDKGRKKTDICKEFNIPKSTLSTYIKNRSRIDNCETSFQPDRKRQRVVKFEDLEKTLFIWFQQARSMLTPLPGSVICAKADEIAKQMSIADFTSNTGWLDRFKKRYGIVFKTVYREAASVSNTSIVAWEDGEFKTIVRSLQQYDAKDIYSADETGLFYRCLPQETHTLLGEKCTREEIPQNRLTVLVAAIADGTDKLPLLVIGKFSKPRCFRNTKNLPIQYFANKKAWMTSSIYEIWMRKLDSNFKAQGRKVAMIVDNCPAHPHLENLQAIDVIELPPNPTSVLQPCDQGIVTALKRHYRETIIQKLLIHINDGNDPNSFDISILDAMYELRSAWNRVTANKVKNCFRQCGFLASDCDTVPCCVEDETESLPHSTGKLFDRLKSLLPESTTMEQYFSVDNDVLTTEALATEDIANSFYDPQEKKYDEAEEEDDSDTHDAPPPPTSKEAREALSTLRRYLATRGEDEFTDTLCSVSSYIDKVSVHSARQSTLYEFFKPIEKNDDLD